MKKLILSIILLSCSFFVLNGQKKSQLQDAFNKVISDYTIKYGLTDKEIEDAAKYYDTISKHKKFSDDFKKLEKEKPSTLRRLKEDLIWKVQAINVQK